MPREQQVGRRLLHPAQRQFLIAEHLQGEFRVEQRIVLAVGEQLAVLVVLDEVVIGILREGQRVEAQGVDHRLAEQAQVRLAGVQLRQIKGDQVVPQQERRVIRQSVQRREGTCQIAGRIRQVVTGDAA